MVKLKPCMELCICFNFINGLCHYNFFFRSLCDPSTGARSRQSSGGDIVPHRFRRRGEDVTKRYSSGASTRCEPLEEGAVIFHSNARDYFYDQSLRTRDPILAPEFSFLQPSFLGDVAPPLGSVESLVSLTSSDCQGWGLILRRVRSSCEVVALSNSVFDKND